MKKIFYALLCTLGLADCSPETVLSPSEYTKEYASALEAEDRDLRVILKADMELKVINKEGKETTTFLDNSYKEYSQRPKDKALIVRKYIAAFLESRIQAATVDRSRITPVIKDRAWLAEVEASMKERGAGKAFDNVHEDLNDELVIVYAEDSPKNLRYLGPKDLEVLALRPEDLKPLAINNLRAILTDIQIQGGDGVWMITAGGDYETSLILFDELWNGSRLKVDGDYVISVPARDMLLVTGTQNREGIKKIKALAEKIVLEAPYHLTADLFAYHAGKFVKYQE